MPKLNELYFYVTNACNLQCTHCWLRMGESRDIRNELNTREIQDIIGQAIPLGLQAVKFTGGEPFLRRDLLDLVSYADHKGLRSRIETNGLAIDDEIAGKLSALQHLSFVAVSLDGATPESHARLRGHVDSFDGTVGAVKTMVSRGVSVEIISCVHRDNVGELDEIISLAIELGAFQIKFNPITHLGRGGEMSDRGELLSVQDVIALHGKLAQAWNHRQEIAVHMSGPVVFRPLDTVRRLGLSDCGILGILGVLADGSLSICGIGLEYPDLLFGNIRESSLEEVWHGDKMATFRREVEAWPAEDAICRRCLVRRYCSFGYCRAEAYAADGRFDGAHPFCQAAYEVGVFPESRLLPS